MSQPASGRQVARTASLLAMLSLLIKPVNFLKDILVAAVFGTTAAKDAFLVAWAVPDLMSSLVTEGLSAVLVPIFTEYASKGQEERAWRVASSIANAILLVLSAAAVVVAVAAPLLVSLLAPAYPPATQALAVHLSRMMAVAIVLMGLQGFLTGILNAHQRFVAPALVPLAFNLAMMAVIVATAGRLGIESLALATVAGAVCMVLIQLPRLPWQRLRYYATIDLHDEGVRRFGKLVGPLMLGTLILSSTNIISRVFASFLPEGSLAALDFALRTTGPAFVIAPALATVLLPTLSRHASLGQWADFQARLTLGVKMHLLVSIPAAAALIILAEPIIRLLFQRGAFDDRSTAMTAAALAWYSLGLGVYGLYYLLINTFYALQDTVVRIWAGLVLVGTYIAANIALIGLMGANGIALSYGLAHAAACALLVVRLGRRLGWRLELAVAGFATRVLAAAIVAAIVIAAVRWAADPSLWQGGLVQLAALLALSGSVGALVYVACLRLLGVGELSRLRDLLRRRP